MKTDIAGIVAGIIIVVVLILGLGFGAYYVTGQGGCDQVEVVTDRDTRWGVWSGCYVQVDDGAYVPLDTWRTPEEAP